MPDSVDFLGIELEAAQAGERVAFICQSINRPMTKEDEKSLWLYSQAISLKRIADALEKLAGKPHA